MVSERLLAETQEVLEDARGLLDRLPPLSPDHESVRMAVVKLRQAGASLDAQRDLSDKALARTRDTIAESRAVVEAIRTSVTKRTRGRVRAAVDGDGLGGVATHPMPRGPATVFLDADTVLLARHHGRYGPELAARSDLSPAIKRLFEISDRVVVVLDPPPADGGHNLDTAHRVAALQTVLSADWDRLVVAVCEHGEDGSCSCAKPGDGLIKPRLWPGRRAQDGWYIGGDQEGMVAGRGAGLHTIRIGPHGSDHLSAVHRPDYEARDLMDAANHIMVEELSAS
jgi:hypothetical protein